MDELTPRDVDRRFGALVGAFGWDSETDDDLTSGVPATLVRRLRPGDVIPVNARARFLMTTFEGQELAAYGWRTGLRIGSRDVRHLPSLKEPGVQLVDERDHYLDAGADAVWVDISRVWVEELVHVPRSHVPTEGAWLRSVLDDQNAPRIEPLQPVAGRSHLIGSRVVHAFGDGRYDVDLRAVSGPLMSGDGTLAVAVVDEAQWYRWHQGSYTAEDRTVGHLPAEELWVE